MARFNDAEMAEIKNTLFAFIDREGNFKDSSQRQQFSAVRGGKCACPTCQGTASAYTDTKKNTQSWKCFTCGEHGDRLDFARLLYPDRQAKELLKDACLDADVPFRDDHHKFSVEDSKAFRAARQRRLQEIQAKRAKEEELLKRCQERSRIEAKRLIFDSHNRFPSPVWAALTSRGIILRNCESRDKVGFVIQYPVTSPKTDKRYLVTGFVFETGREADTCKIRQVGIEGNASGYTATFAVDKAMRHRNVGVNANLFCPEALDQMNPVFVVEGEFDALSCQTVGYHAIALAGARNFEGLLSELKSKKELGLPIPPLVLSLDRDIAGETAIKDLEVELEQLDVPFLAHDIAGRYKDANEHLQSDKPSFIRSLQAGYRTAKETVRDIGCAPPRQAGLERD